MATGDDERDILERDADLQRELTRTVIQWFAVGIVTGTCIWEGAIAIVGWLMRTR